MRFSALGAQMVEQSLDAARRCLAVKKLRRAREICEQVLQFDPKSTPAARCCAKILWEREAWSDALTAYNVSFVCLFYV
jgi:hypothetical protein